MVYSVFLDTSIVLMQRRREHQTNWPGWCISGCFIEWFQLTLIVIIDTLSAHPEITDIYWGDLFSMLSF